MQRKKVIFSNIRINGMKLFFISFDRAFQALSIAIFHSIKSTHSRRKKFDIGYKMRPNRLVLGDFHHYTFVYGQNEYHIRNQHQKLTQKICFFLTKKFCQNYARIPPQAFQIWFRLWLCQHPILMKGFFVRKKHIFWVSFWCWLRIWYSFWP